MIALSMCFLAFLALASAAPHTEFGLYGRQEQRRPFMRPPPPPPYTEFGLYGGQEQRRPFMRPPPPPYRDDNSAELYVSGVFDTGRFWAEMAQEMQKFDQMLNEFYAHFPTTSSDTGIKGNEYVVTITLNGFEEKDIKVKAREGVLMVQAVHKSDEGDERSYLDVKTLPTYVNVNGTWTYDMGILKIVFPLNSRPEEVTETAVTEVETQGPNTENHDREEVEETQNENVNHDADVGLERGDRDRETEILTNVIPNENTVEATTYAVDLKNEVEFVPVKY